MKLFKTYTLLSLLWLNPLQETLGQSHVEVTKFETTYLPSQELPGGLYHTQFDVLLPIVVDQSSVIITGFNIDNLFTTQTTHTQATATALKLGVVVTHSEKLKGTYVALPKKTWGSHYSKNRELQLGSLLLWKLSLDSGVKIKSGLYSNNEQFGWFMVPLLGFELRKGRYEINATLPMMANASYDLGSQFQIGANFTANRSTFAMSDKTKSYLEKNLKHIGVFVQKDLGNFRFFTNASIGLNNRVEIYPSDQKTQIVVSPITSNDKRQPQSVHTFQPYSFKCGVKYRIAV